MDIKKEACLKSINTVLLVALSTNMLCDLCFILLFGVNAIVSDGAGIMSSQTPKGECCCGGFATEHPEADATPLLSQMPGLLVTCDEAGATTCQALCLALATATKAKGPEILCDRLCHANELKLSAFFKICEKPWSFAGMTAEASLCCEDSKPKPCASVNANATDITI